MSADQSQSLRSERNEAARANISQARSVLERQARKMTAVAVVNRERADEGDAPATKADHE